VRDVIQPGRDLGHVDRDYPKTTATAAEGGGGTEDGGEQGKAKSSEEEGKGKKGVSCESGRCEDCE